MIVMSTHYMSRPAQGALDVLSSLSELTIQARIVELAHEDKLTLGIRQMFKAGVSVDDLSAATGLAPAEIRRRLKCELHLTEDLDELAGVG